ncbi:MAG TPA: PIG-L deacetylase family protein [Candidatus Saccharimonadales bacterium]|nr:PIG-L deacetylase family protein [Candidatus Saccharimonadales bacterium]
MAQKDFPPLKPKVVLGVVAHPDDLEFTSAGTVAKFVADGAKAYYFILTNANKGSDDRSIQPDALRDLRRKEQRAAAKILGLTDVFFGDYDDGTLECGQAVKRDIVRVIRQVKPDVVITMDPSVLYSAERGIVNHPDHRAAGQAALDAVYPLARDHLSFPELLAGGLEPHKTPTLLLVNFEKPNYYVDITDVMQAKLDALCAHTSQISNPEGASALVRSWAEAAGKASGVHYAEGFVRIDIRL